MCLCKPSSRQCCIAGPPRMDNIALHVRVCFSCPTSAPLPPWIARALRGGLLPGPQLLGQRRGIRFVVRAGWGGSWAILGYPAVAGLASCCCMGDRQQPCVGCSQCCCSGRDWRLN